MIEFILKQLFAGFVGWLIVVIPYVVITLLMNHGQVVVMKNRYLEGVCHTPLQDQHDII